MGKLAFPFKRILEVIVPELLVNNYLLKTYSDGTTKIIEVARQVPLSRITSSKVLAAIAQLNYEETGDCIYHANHEPAQYLIDEFNQLNH